MEPSMTAEAAMVVMVPLRLRLRLPKRKMTTTTKTSTPPIMIIKMMTRNHLIFQNSLKRPWLKQQKKEKVVNVQHQQKKY
jgi:hypothetical protein